MASVWAARDEGRRRERTARRGRRGRAGLGFIGGIVAGQACPSKPHPPEPPLPLYRPPPAFVSVSAFSGFFRASSIQLFAGSSLGFRDWAWRQASSADSRLPRAR